MRNKFRKFKELTSRSKHRSGKTYCLTEKFDTFNVVNPRWPYQIFKFKKSSWTDIEKQSLRR